MVNKKPAMRINKYLAGMTTVPIHEQIVFFNEPGIEFAHGQVLCEPHDGLAMFGPVDLNEPSHPKNTSYAVVGTREGGQAFELFANRLRGPIFLTENMESPRLWPAFPGFEAAFGAAWPDRPTRVVDDMDRDALLTCAEDQDPFKRTGEVVDRYMQAIDRICIREELLSVIICVVPDLVYRNCRPESRVAEGVGVKVSIREGRLQAAQAGLFNAYNPLHYRYSVDFRRQIKAMAMKHKVPIQIVRESTLRLTAPTEQDVRGLTPLCDRAWNLSVALFYKAGGRPWRLNTARPGVCYIGIAYRLAPNTKKPNTACCAAQLFLDDGDGIVFKGEYGPWYSQATKEFQLQKASAPKLLSGVLETYASLGGKPLTEVFLHCRSGLNDEEMAGFQAACPSKVKLVGIRIRRASQALRLFREGRKPVLRGIFLQGDAKFGYLWTTGFKPRLQTYDGWETPVPYRLDIQHGEADIQQVAEDILGLTKLNYNACKLGDTAPVTIGFSDAVGEILVSNPYVKAQDISPKFKFYI